MATEDRKAVLLRAAYDLLKRCSESYYVRSVNETCAHYDGADCDVECLFEDIEAELGLDDTTTPIPLEEE